LSSVATSRFAARRVVRPATVWIAARSTPTNERLVRALLERGVGAALVEPPTLSVRVRRGDTVLARLDVRRTLDGVEDGIWELRRVEHRGARVLNPAPSLPFPIVVKPRFGSWGGDVLRCRAAATRCSR
jgi:hypothetical protein